MFGPVMGNFFNSRREFLYEQCSLHITEKIPSSVKLGSRSRIFLMRSNSSGARPCCATTSGVTIGSTFGAWLVIGTSRYRIRGPAQLRKLAISSNSGDAERSNRRRTRDTLGASVKSPSYEVWGEHQHKQGGIIVKKTIVTLACALIAPLAFAQTSTTTTEQTTTTQPTTTTETTTTNTAGTVTTYEPGKTIVVKSGEGPVSFALGTTARIVNGAGNVVKSALKPGQRVRVYYTGTGDTRAVEHVVVED